MLKKTQKKKVGVEPVRFSSQFLELFNHPVHDYITFFSPVVFSCFSLSSAKIPTLNRRLLMCKRTNTSNHLEKLPIGVHFICSSERLCCIIFTTEPTFNQRVGTVYLEVRLFPSCKRPCWFFCFFLFF